MKKLFLAIFLIATPLTFAQSDWNEWTFAVTFDTASSVDSVGYGILLVAGQVPVAVWVDTLTDAATIGFDVIIGDTTDATEEDWRTLTLTDDGSNDWSATLTDDKITPLDPSIMMSLLSRDGYRSQQVFIRPFISAVQDQTIIVYIRVRYL